MKIKITKELLESSEPGAILCAGQFNDSGATNIADTGFDIWWLAVRGQGAPDWTIYHECIYSNESDCHPNLCEWTYGQIKRMGDKFPKSMSRELVDVDEHSYKMYRI